MEDLEAGGQFRSVFARQVAEDEVRSSLETAETVVQRMRAASSSGDGSSALRREVGVSSLWRQGQQERETVVRHPRLSYETPSEEEQWVSPERFRHILDQKEHSLHNSAALLGRQGSSVSPDVRPGVLRNRVLSLGGLPSGMAGSSSPIQVERLERENRELRRQLSHVESRVESVGEYMELQSKVAVLQAQITHMETSKDVYEASTKHLLTFLDAFTARLSGNGSSPSNLRESTRPRRRSAGAAGFGGRDARRSEQEAQSSEGQGYESFPCRNSIGVCGEASRRLHYMQTPDMNVNRPEAARSHAIKLGVGSLGRTSDEGTLRRTRLRSSKSQAGSMPLVHPPKYPEPRQRGMIMGSNSVVRRRASLHGGDGSQHRHGHFTMSHLDLRSSKQDDSDSTDDICIKRKEQFKTISGKSKSLASMVSSCSSAMGEMGADSIRSKDSGRGSDFVEATRSSFSSLDVSQSEKEGGEGKMQRFLRQLKKLWIKEKVKKREKGDEGGVPLLGSSFIPRESSILEDVAEEKSGSLEGAKNVGKISRSNSEQELMTAKKFTTPENNNSKKLKSFHHSTPKLLKELSTKSTGNSSNNLPAYCDKF